MGYNKFIYMEGILQKISEGGFDGNFINYVNLILALKHAHIARRSRYLRRDKS